MPHMGVVPDIPQRAPHNMDVLSQGTLRRPAGYIETGLTQDPLQVRRADASELPLMGQVLTKGAHPALTIAIGHGAPYQVKLFKDLPGYQGTRPLLLALNTIPSI